MMGEQVGGNLANGNMQTLGRIGVYMVGGTAVGAAMGHGPESGWAEAEDLLGLAAWGSAGKGAGIANDDPNMRSLDGEGDYQPTQEQLDNPPPTRDQIANKPPYAKDVGKWYKAGGYITIDDLGVWTYHDSMGNAVSYPSGYPDFKSAGYVHQEVTLPDGFKGYGKDFTDADRIASERGQPSTDMRKYPNI